MSGAAARVTRVPAGLPEGYYECFANLYRDIASQLSARIEGVEADPASLSVPDGNSGLEAVRFVAAVLESNNANSSWKDLL